MTYAQYGEDTIVDALLGRPEYGAIVDIGAGDGVEISNSRLFRERGWYTLLVEPDPRHTAALDALTGERCAVVAEAVTPGTINDFIPENGRTGSIPPVDLPIVLSIDVDGDDIFLLEALERRPDVIIIEHNPTMPYHIDVQPARLGLQIGASVAALARVALGKGYGLAAVTHCNAVFHLGEGSIPLPEYRPAYAVATEYFTGRPVVLGEAPWGMDLALPYPADDVVIR